MVVVWLVGWFLINISVIDFYKEYNVQTLEASSPVVIILLIETVYTRFKLN